MCSLSGKARRCLLRLRAGFFSLLLVLLAGRAFADNVLDALEIQLLGPQAKGTLLPGEAERLARLENAVGVKPNPSLSKAYRINRLVHLASVQTATDRQREAVDWYNRGVEAETGHQATAAMAAYRRALDADPLMIPAINNLGSLLFQAGQADEAVTLFVQGLAVRPNEPLLHRNLGLVYEKQGRIVEAVDEYERYIALAPLPDPPIQAIVASFQANRKLVEGVPDYLAAVTEASPGHRLLWPDSAGPLQVFVPPVPPDQAFVPLMLRRALEAWSQATDGHLRFAWTNVPGQANLEIVLKEAPLRQSSLEIGRTEYHMPLRQVKRGSLEHVRITMNVGEPGDVSPDRAERFYRLALHETGHALGLWGHSPTPDDVMFAHPVAPKLSARDIRTIRLLYHLPTGEGNLSRRADSSDPDTQTAPTTRIMR